MINKRKLIISCANRMIDRLNTEKEMILKKEVGMVFTLNAIQLRNFLLARDLSLKAIDNLKNDAIAVKVNAINETLDKIENNFANLIKLNILSCDDIIAILIKDTLRKVKSQYELRRQQ